MPNQVLEHHEHVLNNHEEKFNQLQQDVIDIKTRLGIKDITNGQVLKYHQKLVDDQKREIDERKEQDAILREQLNKVDSRTWAILVGIIIVFLSQIIQAII